MVEVKSSDHWLNRTHVGDCRPLLAKMSAEGVKVQTCVTSPPYFGLRDYGHSEQIGLEASPSAYVGAIVDVFRAVREVMADDGTLWLNLGDSYAGSWGAQGRQGKAGQMATRSVISARQMDAHPQRTSQTGSLSKMEGLKAKDLIGIPWRVAFALQLDGWYLRQDIIWHKPNPMPESVTDRCTKSHEYVFLLAKSERYYCDMAAIAERAAYPEGAGNMDGNKYVAAAAEDECHRTKAGLAQIGPRESRNRRSVWSVTTKPFAGAHFATFPRDLIEPCILAGAPAGGIVLDPFMGSGTTGQVAEDLGRRFIGCELNPAYVALHEDRRTTIGMPL